MIKRYIIGYKNKNGSFVTQRTKGAIHTAIFDIALKKIVYVGLRYFDLNHPYCNTREMLKLFDKEEMLYQKQIIDFMQSHK